MGSERGGFSHVPRKETMIKMTLRAQGNQITRASGENTYRWTARGRGRHCSNRL